MKPFLVVVLAYTLLTLLDATEINANLRGLQNIGNGKENAGNSSTGSGGRNNSQSRRNQGIQGGNIGGGRPDLPPGRANGFYGISNGRAFANLVGHGMFDPSRIELNCTNSSDICTRSNGVNGVFICRSYGAPFSDQIENRTRCIAPDRALKGDHCGCCPGQCPRVCNCTCPIESAGGATGNGVVIKVNTIFGFEFKYRCVSNDEAALRVATSDGSVTCAVDCGAVLLDYTT